MHPRRGPRRRDPEGEVVAPHLQRVADALAVCRTWSARTVVDVAASLERDEELLSDVVGPRRNAATLASLDAADVVVVVGTADPVGISRLVRGLEDVRACTGAARLLVIVQFHLGVPSLRECSGFGLLSLGA